MKSCEKTVIPMHTIETIVTDVVREIRCSDTVEVPSHIIGDLVAQKLKGIDKVAYIRFSSVFKRFVDVEEFEREVNKLH